MHLSTPGIHITEAAEHGGTEEKEKNMLGDMRINWKRKEEKTFTPAL